MFLYINSMRNHFNLFFPILLILFILVWGLYPEMLTADSCLCVQGALLACLERPYMFPGIKPRLSACEACVPTPILSHQPLNLFLTVSFRQV